MKMLIARKYLLYLPSLKLLKTSFFISSVYKEWILATLEPNFNLCKNEIEFNNNFNHIF